MKLKQYDVVLVDFGTDAVGSEQLGIRPAIVVQNDIGNFFSTTTIVLPFSKVIKNPKQPTHTLIRCGEGKGLAMDSMLLGECVRQVSEKRIKVLLGRITDMNEQKEVRRVYYANFE